MTHRLAGTYDVLGCGDSSGLSMENFRFFFLCRMLSSLNSSAIVGRFEVTGDCGDDGAGEGCIGDGRNGVSRAGEKNRVEPATALFAIAQLNSGIPPVDIRLLVRANPMNRLLCSFPIIFPASPRARRIILFSFCDSAIFL